MIWALTETAERFQLYENPPQKTPAEWKNT